MPPSSLSGTTAIVTGASRGFGRATAAALAARGAHVVGVARTAESLHVLRDELGDAFHPEVADVTDALLPARLIARYRPHTIVLNAGATPAVGSLREHDWQSFSANWDTDVRQVFHFVRAALAAPLTPGSTVISLSSGAALRGSPLSGGYAGAKATVKFLSAYAGGEAHQAGLGIRFVSVLPALTPATELGRGFTRAYAAKAGMSQTQFTDGFGGELSTQHAGSCIADLAGDYSLTGAAYLLGAAGLRPMEGVPF